MLRCFDTSIPRYLDTPIPRYLDTSLECSLECLKAPLLASMLLASIAPMRYSCFLFPPSPECLGAWSLLRYFDASTPRFDASISRFDTCFAPCFDSRFNNRSEVGVWLRRHSILGFHAFALILASTHGSFDTHFDNRLDTRCFDASKARLSKANVGILPTRRTVTRTPDEPRDGPMNLSFFAWFLGARHHYLRAPIALSSVSWARPQSTPTSTRLAKALLPSSLQVDSFRVSSATPVPRLGARRFSDSTKWTLARNLSGRVPLWACSWQTTLPRGLCCPRHPRLHSSPVHRVDKQYERRHDSS
jgi:hypothetical protein